MEEEYDLKMMAIGAKGENFSQDMNIDNPQLLSMKEKIKEVIYEYNTLAELVKNLIPNVNQNKSNEDIINDIIKVIFGKSPIKWLTTNFGIFAYAYIYFI